MYKTFFSGKSLYERSKTHKSGDSAKINFAYRDFARKIVDHFSGGLAGVRIHCGYKNSPIVFNINFNAGLSDNFINHFTARTNDVFNLIRINCKGYNFWCVLRYFSTWLVYYGKHLV